MMDLYSIGEMVIDFIPGSEPASYIRKAGGAPANVAIAVSKNGLKAAMCCKVGEDDFGRFLMDTLSEYGVKAACPELCREATTTMAFVTLEDLYGECEVVVFPRQFEAVRGMLNEDEEVIVGGKAQYDGEDGSAKILTEEMTRFADVPKTLCVRFEDMESYEAEKEYLENKAKKGGDSLCVCVGRRPHMKRKILRNAIDAAEMAGAFEERYGKKNVAVTA